jgi:hypothetical protein
MSHPTPHKQTTIFLLLVILVGVLLALLTLEGLFRAIRLLSTEPRWSDRPIGYFFPNTGNNLQEKRVTTKQLGTFRIAVVGDSFTFGPRMQLGDTFPKRLEGFLNLNDTAPPVEVLNRGHSGYSTVKEVGVVKDAIANGADVVLLQITLNDAEPHPLTKEERERVFEAPFLNSSFFKTWTSLHFLLMRVNNKLSHQKYIDYHTRFFFDEATYIPFRESISEMKRMADAHGVKLLSVLFPLFDFPFDESYPLKQAHQRIREVVEERGVPLLDLRGAYSGIPFERLQVVPGVDSHPNEIAHRIAAERILAFLARTKTVPEGNLPRRVYPERRAHFTKSTSVARVWQLSLRFLDNPDGQKPRRTKSKKKRDHARKELG